MLGCVGMPLLGDARYGDDHEGDPTHHGMRDAFLPLHAATLMLAHPLAEQPALRLRAPLPAEWRYRLPAALVAAADAALADEGGLLWEEPPEPPDVA